MEDKTESIIPVETARTLAGLFRERVRRSAERVAYRNYDRGSRKWLDVTWAQMAALVGRAQAALSQESVTTGDRVAILMRNSPDWIMFDQAALGQGLVVVPLYTEDRPDNIAFILSDAAVKFLAVGDARLWRRLRPALDGVDTLQRVVVCAGELDADERDDRVRSLADWLPEGNHPLLKHDGSPEQLASIVYTSGTTGRPKGVMLSHLNMLTNAHSGLLRYEVYEEDSFVSFLPLSHTFERTVGYYLTMMAGASVAYARSIPQLAEDLQTLNPTALIAVPRIFERAYVRIHQQLEKKPAFARWLFAATAHIGWKRFLARQGRGRRNVLEIVWPLLDHLVAGKVRASLGNRLRLAVSGGAALPFPVARTLIGLNINIVQGYGMTEASPVISANPEDDNDPNSVGVPLAGVEVRVGENDELLVRSPGLMQGYWNNHAATREAIDSDGWLHTGDQGRIENNHIYITGRLKDILVLSNGEKVPPDDMEGAIILDPLFDQALVIGEGKPFLSALVVLNPDEWVKVANRIPVDPYAETSLLNDRVLREVTDRVRKTLREFPGYAKVRRLVLTREPWTVDNGLLTPTLKLKRARVLERYAEQVAQIYAS